MHGQPNIKVTHKVLWNMFGFCNPFSVYFSYSIYSKVPKTKSCLFVDI